jgi:hypothetical protein
MTNYDSIIEQADRLRTTINTIGWQDILKIKNDKKEYFVNKALTEKDINKIYYAQAYVEASDNIFREIDALIKNAEEAEKLRKNK